MPFDSPKKPHRRPLDDRLAERTPRADGAKPAHFLQSRPVVRVDKPEELCALIVGAMVIQKADAFGQSRLFGRAIEGLVERATKDLTSREVMELEVEAYAIADWLVGGSPVLSADKEAIARRDGDQILYDPKASTVDLLQRAIDEEFDVKIDYFSRARGEMNTRRITPRALEAETYLRAYCHSRSDERSFRLNRVTRCVPVKGRPMEVLQIPAVVEAPPSASPGRPVQGSLLDD